jgi:hypothetical protein
MVNLSDDTKARFDDHQPEDMTQGEFVAAMLDLWAFTDDDRRMQPHKFREELAATERRVLAACELGGYRGAQEALEDQ